MIFCHEFCHEFLKHPIYKAFSDNVKVSDSR